MNSMTILATTGRITPYATTDADRAWGAAGAVVFVALFAAYALLVIGAFISALAAPMSGGMKLVWIIFIFIAPFIGSMLWFMIGRRNARVSAGW